MQSGWIYWEDNRIEYLEHRIEGETEPDVHITRQFHLEGEKMYDGYYTRDVYGVQIKRVCTQQEYGKLWDHFYNMTNPLNTC